jgi:hypothetical protein
MLNELSHYLISRNVLEAIMLPAVVSIFITTIYRKEFSIALLAPFVIGTAQSIFLSTWWEGGEQLSLHVFPACTVILIAMPGKFRPTWKVGYCLSFFSVLLTDWVCTLRYAIDVNCLSASFFCGVGGAGFQDALFWYPLLCALMLGAINFAISQGGHAVNIRFPLSLSR